MICECGNKRMNNGTLLCAECYEKQNEMLKTKVRDVETFHETREEFLLRKSHELGFSYKPRDIVSFIRAGLTDALILKGYSPRDIARG